MKCLKQKIKYLDPSSNGEMMFQQFTLKRWQNILFTICIGSKKEKFMKKYNTTWRLT